MQKASPLGNRASKARMRPEPQEVRGASARQSPVDLVALEMHWRGGLTMASSDRLRRESRRASPALRSGAPEDENEGIRRLVQDFFSATLCAFATFSRSFTSFQAPFGNLGSESLVGFRRIFPLDLE